VIAPRHHFADGGMPYSDEICGPDGGSEIPDQKPYKSQPLKPGGGGGGPGAPCALCQAGKAAGDVMKIMELAAMFMNTGGVAGGLAGRRRLASGGLAGRHGYDDGGTATGDGGGNTSAYLQAMAAGDNGPDPDRESRIARINSINNAQSNVPAPQTDLQQQQHQLNSQDYFFAPIAKGLGNIVGGAARGIGSGVSNFLNAPGIVEKYQKPPAGGVAPAVNPHPTEVDTPAQIHAKIDADAASAHADAATAQAKAGVAAAPAKKRAPKLQGVVPAAPPAAPAAPPPAAPAAGDNASQGPPSPQPTAQPTAAPPDSVQNAIRLDGSLALPAAPPAAQSAAVTLGANQAQAQTPQKSASDDVVHRALHIAGNAAAGSNNIVHGALGALGTGLTSYAHQLSDPTDPNYRNAWMSVLQGVAAAAAAPTQHLGTALAVGLGAGAKGYGESQAQQAEIGQTQAQAKRQSVAATAQEIDMAKNLKIQESLGLLRADPNGSISDVYGNHYSPTNKAAGAGAGSGTSYKYLGKNMSPALSLAQKQFMQDSEFGLKQNPAAVTQSAALSNDISDAGAQAATDLVNIHQQAGALFSPDRKGVMAQGALAPVMEPKVAIWNAIMHAAGKDNLVVQGLGDTQIAQKLQLGQATAQATGAGQHALAALQDYQKVSAGPGMDPAAAAAIMAKQAVFATKDLDRRNVLNEARSTGGNFEAQTLMNSFDQDYRPEDYSKMENSIKQIYLSPEWQNISRGLESPRGSPEYQKAVANINAVGQHSGVINLSRAFTGG
jgi:hypothetical protein